MEAAICANSTGNIPEIERDKEKELDLYIKAINGQLAQARTQGMIYIDDLVIDPIETNHNATSLDCIIAYLNTVSNEIPGFIRSTDMYIESFLDNSLANIQYTVEMKLKGKIDTLKRYGRYDIVGDIGGNDYTIKDLETILEKLQKQRF
jgi:hypothetical protein